MLRAISLTPNITSSQVPHDQSPDRTLARAHRNRIQSSEPPIHVSCDSHFVRTRVFSLTQMSWARGYLGTQNTVCAYDRRALQCDALCQRPSQSSHASRRRRCPMSSHMLLSGSRPRSLARLNIIMVMTVRSAVYNHIGSPPVRIRTLPGAGLITVIVIGPGPPMGSNRTADVATGSIDSTLTPRCGQRAICASARFDTFYVGVWETSPRGLSRSYSSTLARGLRL